MYGSSLLCSVTYVIPWAYMSDGRPDNVEMDLKEANGRGRHADFSPFQSLKARER